MAGELDKLIERLEKAVSIFDNPNEKWKSYETGQYFDHRTAGAILAMNAVLAHLKELGIERRLMAPLLYFATALLDADNMDDAYHKGNKKPLMEAYQLAVAAAAVDLAKDGGDTLEAALSKVAKASGYQVTKSKLKDFRKNMRIGRARWEAIELYRLIKAARTIPPEQKPARAAAALRAVSINFRPSKKV